LSIAGESQKKESTSQIALLAACADVAEHFSRGLVALAAKKTPYASSELHFDCCQWAAP